MFDRSAAYYDHFYGFLDYPAAARNLERLIETHHGDARTLLDVACGTGRYLEHLQSDYQAAGLDILPSLLAQAAIRCPELPFHQGDMCDFDLGEKYDVVTCLFCSIGYVQTLDRMRQAISRMAAHLKPGGLLVVEPWVTPEKCWTNRVTCEVANEPELKIVRMHTHEIEGRLSIFDIHYLVGTPEGVEHFVEREAMGLFTQSEYAAAMTDAGLAVTYLDSGLFPGHAYGLYLGKAPA